MSYLHVHGILHRHLKPDNVLLDDCLFQKVGDFGFSKSDTSDIFTKTATGTIKNTPAFILPEIWNYFKYTKASNVYAFSIVVFELMTTTRALADLNFYGKLAAIPRGRCPMFDVPVRDAYKWLIIGCWMQDTSDRPTFDEIVAELQNGFS